mmetsp:Transcript_35740/g.93455  ORF Transcript_35740/g.93455 Transcript_35740/m.93455 type:complete len:436 (+) Transcript_35740:37-1344(+)
MAAGAAEERAITEYYVRVNDHARKSANGNDYVAFAVESYLKADVGNDDLQPDVVWRRYSDFDTFRAFLVATIPSAVIPPIPEKTINFKLSKMAVDKFDKEMLKKRQEGFQRFMSRLMSHPRIVTVDIVKHFVRTQDWKAHLMVKRGGKMVPWSATGVNDAMANSVDKFEMSFKRGQKEEAGIASELNYCNQLKDSVLSLLGVHHKLLQTMHLVESNLTEVGAALHETRTIGANSENAEFQVLSELFDNAAATVLELAQQEELQFSDPVKEYALYTDAVKEILLFQWRLSDGLDSKEQDIIAKQKSIEGWEKPEGLSNFFRSFKSKENQAKEAQKEKAELAILQSEVAEMMEKKGNFDKQVDAELTRVRDDRVQGIKRILLAYARLHVKFYEKNIAVMTDIIDSSGYDEGDLATSPPPPAVADDEVEAGAAPNDDE